MGSDSASKTEFALFDAAEFAEFAVLFRHRWGAVGDAFLFHTSVGATRVRSMKIGSSAGFRTSPLSLPENPEGWKHPVSRAVLFTEFTNGNVTELLIPVAAARAVSRQDGFSRKMALRPEGLSPIQRERLKALMGAARSYRKAQLEQERERQARLEQKQRDYEEYLEKQRLQRAAELQRQAAERRERVAAIKNICQQREIARLVHFTRLANLGSILEKGLLSKRDLNSMVEQGLMGLIQFNDEQRLDKQPGAVCMSISFPNYQTFYRYKQRIKEPWVILTVDSAFYGNWIAHSARRMPRLVRWLTSR